MGKQTLLDCRLFTGGADLSGWSNKVEIATASETKDATNYRSAGWTEVLGGLRSAEIVGEGQWEAGDPGKVDDRSWADLGGLTGWTICPTDSIVGATAYLTKVLRGKYMLGGTVGDVAPWKADGQGSWPLARGKILHPPGTPRTATGTGTAVELSAASSAQYVYAALHVLSVSGTTPSMTVKVQSDADSGFASPADVLTFDAATAVSGQVLRAAGPITDTWYRASWTISGTTPSFLFALSVGVA